MFLKIKCGPGFEPQVTVIAFDPEVIRSVKIANPELQANGLGTPKDARRFLSWSTRSITTNVPEKLKAKH